ncbi:MAG: hypothetical protein J5J06_06870 [Phycisphaerae bacterium]|nr:hypothetical protein [Phycisphaerae bacterium]
MSPFDADWYMRRNIALKPTAVLLIAVVLGASGRAAPGEPIPLEQFVPEQASWYIHLPAPEKVERELKRANAWPLARKIADLDGGDSSAASLANMATRFLGPESAIPVDQLLSCEWLIVTPALGDVRRGTWLIRLPNDAALERWFPKERRQSERMVDQARLFRMRDGTYVCAREGVIAVARRFSDGLLVRTVQKLMVLGGVHGRPITARKDFLEMSRRIPPDALAVFYAAIRMPNATSSSPISGNSPHSKAGAIRASGSSSAIAPGQESDGAADSRNTSRALVGVYARSAGLEISISADLPSARVGAPLSRQALERMRRLPQTTLAAVGLTLDFGRAFSRGGSSGSADAVQRYLQLLSDLSRGEGERNPVLARVGPDVIVVWGQDLSEEGLGPQFAVLVRSPDARAVRNEITKLARNLIALIQAVDPVPADSAPTFKLAPYLGAPIVHVPLQSYARKSKLPFARLLESLDPAWTSWRDWVILALDRTHIERILDAQAGLAPTLGGLAAFQSSEENQPDTRLLAVAQAGLTAEVLQGWLEDRGSDAALLWNMLWWPEESLTEGRAAPPPIELKEESSPNCLVVTRDLQTTVDAGLRAGDLILGVDGKLLSLGNMREDFNRKVANSTAPGPTIRVLRAGEMLDVPLPRLIGSRAQDLTRSSSLNLLRQFAVIGEYVQTVNLSVRSADGKRFDSTISLRFAESAE